MQTTAELFEDTFKHSIVILWDETKQKWKAECIMLNIRFEADTYKELIIGVISKIHAQDEYFFEASEKTKSKIPKL